MHNSFSIIIFVSQKNSKMENPFYLTASIPDKYFCDRTAETEMLVRYVTNGNNVVLVSPRRMGKSGLIFHSYNDARIKDNYNTLYVDILQSSSLREFVYLFGKAVFDNLVPKTTKWIQKFAATVRSIGGRLTFDPLSGSPTLSLALGEINAPLYTLEEIFKYIEACSRHCIIAIDEFQQITKYPEKNIEAILRTHIQHIRNANFIYAGSERHVMTQMFASYSRPFYQSASFLTLDAIEKEVYVKFAERLFQQGGKRINKDDITYLYDLFDGFTFYMQKTLNQCYGSIKEKGTCDLNLINNSIELILETEAPTFRAILSNISERQKELLYAIALAGKARNITSQEFINTYKLSGASSVQSATKQLLEKDFISRHDDYYFLTNKFMELWIKRIYGI